MDKVKVALMALFAIGDSFALSIELLPRAARLSPTIPPSLTHPSTKKRIPGTAADPSMLANQARNR
jgi:hypothetical protein